MPAELCGAWHCAVMQVVLRLNTALVNKSRQFMHSKHARSGAWHQLSNAVMVAMQLTSTSTAGSWQLLEQKTCLTRVTR